MTLPFNSVPLVIKIVRGSARDVQDQHDQLSEFPYLVTVNLTLRGEEQHDFPRRYTRLFQVPLEDNNLLLIEIYPSPDDINVPRVFFRYVRGRELENPVIPRIPLASSADEEYIKTIVKENIRRAIEGSFIFSPSDIASES